MLNKGVELTKSEFIEREYLEHLLFALMPENRLACEVCLKTGLRISDVLSLKTADLSERMTVVEQKTGKKKRITLGKRLCAELLEIAGEYYVFEHRDDPRRHRTRQAVYMDIKRATKAFRIKANFSTHSIRKIYAVDLMRKYGDIEKVRLALNHNNETVTLIYALADQIKAKSYKKRH